MKKLLVLFLMTIICLNFISALEWDNVKTYDSNTKTLKIKNSFLGMPTTEVATLKLLTPQHNIIWGEGYHRVAEIEIDNADDYTNALKKIDFYKVYFGMSKVSESYDYKYRVEKEVYRDVYNTTCTNPEIFSTCHQDIIGKEKVIEYEWKTLNPNQALPKGKIIVGIYYSNVKANEIVEWIPTFFGIEINEWASFSGATMYERYLTATDDAWAMGSTAGWTGGQQYIIGNSSTNEEFNLRGFTLLLYKENAPTTCDFCVYNDSGSNTMGANLGCNNSVDVSGITAINNGEWFNITMPSVTMKPSTKYWINLSGCPANNLRWRGVSVAPSYGGIQYVGYAGGYAVGNDFNFMVWGDKFFPANITTTLLSPATLFSTASNTITFNATSSAFYDANVTNATIFVWNNSGFIFNQTTRYFNTNETRNNTWNITLVEGNYIWNVLSCGVNISMGVICNMDTNRTFSIDSTKPRFIIYAPTDNTTTTSASVIIEVNATIIDNNLQNCTYWTNEDATETYYPCNQWFNATFSNAGAYIISLKANDTVGNTNHTNISYYINRITEMVNFTSSVLEGSSFKVNFNLSASSITQSNATINYYGATYPMTLVYSNSSFAEYIETISAPLINPQSIATPINISYSINDNARLSYTQNQTIFNLSFVDCGAGLTPILNLTLKDEELNELTNVTSPNTAIIELDLILTNKNNASINVTYAKTWLNNQTVAVCLANVSGGDYKIDFVAGYESTGRVREFYYLDNGTLDGSHYFNPYTDDTIDLMDLATADSTTFLFTFTDADGLTIPDAIVHTYRKYIGEGIYREVERSKQDNNGQTHIHLVEEDVIYYFMVTQYGTIIYTSDSYNAKCLSTPCEISLTSAEEGTNWTLADNEGGKYDVSVNKNTRIVSTTFNIGTPANVTTKLYRFINNVDTLINSSSLYSASGTINMHVPLTYDNSTFFVAIFKNSNFIKSEWINLQESGQTYFGTTGAILGGLIILAMLLMAVSEGAGTIVFTCLALAVIGIMQLVDLSWMAIISIICAGAIIIFKLVNRGRKQG